MESKLHQLKFETLSSRQLTRCNESPSKAERERIARVTLATAEFEASAKMIEAAKMYESSQKVYALDG